MYAGPDAPHQPPLCGTQPPARTRPIQSNTSARSFDLAGDTLVSKAKVTKKAKAAKKHKGKKGKGKKKTKR